MKNIIYVYVGVAGSGKDFSCKIETLTGCKKRFVKIDFSDALRNLTKNFLGFWFKDYDGAKDKVIGLHDYPKWVSDLSLKFFPKLITLRWLLMGIGTEIVRKISKNYVADTWKRKCLSYLDKEEPYAIFNSDLRFINELQAALELNKREDTLLVVTFCNYISNRYNCRINHPSEKLAQYLLKDGYQHGDIIPNTYLEDLVENWES